MDKYLQKVIVQNSVYYYVLDIYDEERQIVKVVDIDSVENIETFVEKPLEKELPALICVVPTIVKIVELGKEQETMLNNWYLKNKIIGEI